jgi:hypothetical protein
MIFDEFYELIFSNFLHKFCLSKGYHITREDKKNLDGNFVLSKI